MRGQSSHGRRGETWSGWNARRPCRALEEVLRCARIAPDQVPAIGELRCLGLVRFFRNGLSPRGFQRSVSNPATQQNWRSFRPDSGKNISASFPSPAHTVRSNPHVHPSRSNPTSHCGNSREKGCEVARRRREVTLAVWEVTKRRREVEAWCREVEGWRHESTPASSSRTTSRNSVAAFSPVSAFRSPALSFFPLSGGRCVSGAQARAAGVMDHARPSWSRSLPSRSAQIHLLATHGLACR
jgi:hypothetical protein